MLLDYDPFTGIEQHWKKDNQTGKVIIESIQDVEPVLNANALAASQLNKKSDYWYVGTIPNVLCMQWAAECGKPVFSKEWNEYAMKKLNERDYAKLNQNRIKI